LKLLRLVALLSVFATASFELKTLQAADNNRPLLGPTHPALRMPGQGQRGAGFDVAVEVTQQEEAGYLPVRIAITAQGTFTADRQLTVRFQTEPGGTSPPRNGMVVDVPITANQGNQNETIIRYLPKWYAGQMLEVSVLEDGRPLENYSARFGNVLGQGPQATMELLRSESHLSVLYIADADDSASDVLAKQDMFVSASPPLGNMYHAVNRIDEWYIALRARLCRTCGQREAPTDWRAYNRFDWVVLSWESLGQLKKDVAAFSSLRSWVLVGGTVLIYDAEDPQSALSELDFTWNADQASEDRVAAASKLNAQELNSYEEQLRSAIEPMNSEVTPEVLQYFQNELLLLRDLKPIATTLWLQTAAAGNVIVMKRTQDGSFPSIAHWRTAAKLADYRISATLRRGVDPLLGDARFSRWMIPGVAEPPVYTFMGLLTVFVILVGPIAYRKTTKHGRGYLMFAIAPILALITTFSMFTYGILADGFGTIVRVRQVTWIDGQSGDAAQRVRSTYFAGLQPRNDLPFAGDTEVFAYFDTPEKSWESLNLEPFDSLGLLTVTEYKQLFAPEYLPSRQQRQFVTHQPRLSYGALKSIPNPDGALPPSLQNGLSFTLHEVVFRDAVGNYWRVDSLSAGETKPAVALDRKQASKMLGAIYAKHRPISQVRETRENSRVNYQFTYDVIASLNRSTSSVTDGIFENQLQLWLQTEGEIPQSHFVAIGDVTPDVVVVEDCQVVESVHYLLGTLP
jgi:hypothetical protein